MDFQQATRGFEQWLGKQVDLQKDELAYKHQQMAGSDPFPFFRGTYYRWVQLWPAACPALQKAPRVLSVGDLHIENFGTWRDSDARLVWGITDLDEADELPCTNDLVRLASSAWFAIRTGELDLDFRKACRKILDGYVAQLESEAGAFVLEEKHSELRSIAMDDALNPVDFWKKLNAIDDKPKKNDRLAAKAHAVLHRALPKTARPKGFHRRPQVGMGSLGKPRFVAIAFCNGGAVAREAKALCGPATHWFRKGPATPSRIEEALSKIIRSPDPMYRVDGAWMVRRLAPHSSRIELEYLRKSSDLALVMKAMGAETANIHKGTARKPTEVLAYVSSLPKGWLEKAARKVSKELVKDWKSWRRSQDEHQHRN